MAVDQEIAVPCILVLANARLNDGCVLERRNVFLQIGAQALLRNLADDTLTAVGIELHSVLVKRDLEAAVLNVWQRVRTVRMRMVQPSRHLAHAECFVVRRAEEENFLAGGEDTLAQKLGKQFGQPGSAGKDECASGDGFAQSGLDLCKLPLRFRRKHSRRPVINAVLHQIIDQGLHRLTCHQHAALRLQHSHRGPRTAPRGLGWKRRFGKAQLRIAAAQFRGAELLALDAQPIQQFPHLFHVSV